MNVVQFTFELLTHYLWVVQTVDRLNSIHAVTKQEQKLMRHDERDIYAFLVKDLLEVSPVWVVPLDVTQVVSSPHFEDLFRDTLVDQPESFVDQFVI